MRVRRSYRQYESSFREDAVALLNRSERAFGQVARDLGVPLTTLIGWYNADMAKKGKDRERSKGGIFLGGRAGAEAPAEKLARLEREVEVLRKENEDLKQDRAILKKAAAFFAKESE
jgi:transposase